MSQDSAPSQRRKHAAESFQNAGECLGKIERGMSLFAVTRGQFSMIDAILACLDQIGPAAVSLWTWTVAEYEIQCLDLLRTDGRLTAGLLVIDYGARNKNAGLIRQWKTSHGPDSVRYVVNHAKMATIRSAQFRLLLRGSMNLNFNPRFEQLDVTEGGADFDLVERIELELPILSDSAMGNEVFSGSRVSDVFNSEQLAVFRGIKTWAK